MSLGSYLLLVYVVVRGQTPDAVVGETFTI